MDTGTKRKNGFSILPNVVVRARPIICYRTPFTTNNLLPDYCPVANDWLKGPEASGGAQALFSLPRLLRVMRPSSATAPTAPPLPHDPAGPLKFWPGKKKPTSSLLFINLFSSAGAGCEPAPHRASARPPIGCGLHNSAPSIWLQPNALPGARLSANRALAAQQRLRMLIWWFKSNYAL